MVDFFLANNNTRLIASGKKMLMLQFSFVGWNNYGTFLTVIRLNCGLGIANETEMLEMFKNAYEC